MSESVDAWQVMGHCAAGGLPPSCFNAATTAHNGHSQLRTAKPFFLGLWELGSLFLSIQGRTMRARGAAAEASSLFSTLTGELRLVTLAAETRVETARVTLENQRRRIVRREGGLFCLCEGRERLESQRTR